MHRCEAYLFNWVVPLSSHTIGEQAGILAFSTIVARERRSVSAWRTVMREKLAALRAAFLELRRASVFKKTFAAEAALSVAVELLEKIVEEIERLKAAGGGADRKTSPER